MTILLKLPNSLAYFRLVDTISFTLGYYMAGNFVLVIHIGNLPIHDVAYDRFVFSQRIRSFSESGMAFMDVDFASFSIVLKAIKSLYEQLLQLDELALTYARKSVKCSG